MELKACYHGDYEIPFTIANPKVTRNILAPSRNSLQNMLRLLCEAVNAAEEQHTADSLLHCELSGSGKLCQGGVALSQC